MSGDADAETLVMAAMLLSIGVVLGGALALLALRAGQGKRGENIAEERVSPDMQKTTVSAETSKSVQEALAIQAGFSMKEALTNAETNRDEAMQKTPLDVMAELQRGNTRFWMGQAVRPEKSAFQRRALINMQFPKIAILSCSDSRVPVEIVFDQGLGDMFVVRVAGNCLDVASKASLQYAVHHLKVKVLLVMGHEACGAVKAAQLPPEQIGKEPQELATALHGLKKCLAGGDLTKIIDAKSKDREAVTLNVKSQVEALKKDDGIMAKIRRGELLMAGAFYEISSGSVDFVEEVWRDSLEKEVQKGTAQSQAQHQAQNFAERPQRAEA